MITTKNILNEYPKLDQAVLPAQLKQAEFDFLAENIDLYGQDETIDQFIDLFIEKLNKIKPVEKKTPNKDKATARLKNLRKATKAKQAKKETMPDKATKKEVKAIRKIKSRKPKRIKTMPIKAKVSKIPKAKKEEIIKPEITKIPKVKKVMESKKTSFTNIPIWLSVIRKFSAMGNKAFSQSALRNFLKLIQTSFSASKNGSTPHVDLIRAIQLTIVSSVNEQLNKPKVLLKSNSALISKCKEVSKQYSIKKRLPSTEKVQVKAISGIEGLSGLGIITTTDLAKQEFVTLPFEGKFKDLIGSPTKPFQIMVYGLPGSGKSTLAIMFAKYLAENHQFKVLYLAKEEGVSGTSQEKFIRLNAIHPNIHITEKMPTDLSFYDVLFIDSVNEMNMTPDSLRAIIKQYPKLSTVQLFKATKEGKFLGQSDFAHLCQAEIRCFENKAQAQKNRFGGNKEIIILD